MEKNSKVWPNPGFGASLSCTVNLFIAHCPVTEHHWREGGTEKGEREGREGGKRVPLWSSEHWTYSACASSSPSGEQEEHKELKP